ncbi:MAG: hypothetical protein Q9204_004274 [Flavoplaca sp. TL-2023a]
MGRLYCNLSSPGNRRTYDQQYSPSDFTKLTSETHVHHHPPHHQHRLLRHPQTFPPPPPIRHLVTFLALSSKSSAESLYFPYIQKLGSQLLATNNSRLCGVVSKPLEAACAHDLYTTRRRLSEIHGSANEYELWEEMLELVFLVWLKK